MIIAILPNIGGEDACFLISGFKGLREVLSRLDGVERSIASCRLMARLTLKIWESLAVGAAGRDEGVGKSGKSDWMCHLSTAP